MFLVLFVLNDPHQLEPVLDAWERAGVSGVTILHSSGLGRLRQNLLRDDIPLIPSLGDLMEHSEDLHRTLFSVVEDLSLVDRLIDATKNVVGDLSLPGKGLLVVLPVTRAIGLIRNQE